MFIIKRDGSDEFVKSVDEYSRKSGKRIVEGKKEDIIIKGKKVNTTNLPEDALTFPDYGTAAAFCAPLRGYSAEPSHDILIKRIKKLKEKT